MDRARRAGGLLWVAAGLVFQLLWWRRSVVPGPVTVVLCALVVALALLVLTRRRRAVLVLGRVVAVALALDLAGAVADRFGAFGPPGKPGVFWGSWEAFVAYTARLLPVASPRLVALAAVAATATEVVLAVLLVSGWQRRWVGKATAGLLLVYLVAMAWGLGGAAVAAYGVPLLVGGALLVSTCPAGRTPAPARLPVRRLEQERS